MTPGEEASAELGGRTRLSLSSRFGRLMNLVFGRGKERQLRLCEMLPLGERRFIAVVEYGQEKFLVAGTPQTISLLKKFDGECEGVVATQRAKRNLD